MGRRSIYKILIYNLHFFSLYLIINVPKTFTEIQTVKQQEMA